MFQPTRPKTAVGGLFQILGLIFHATVRNLRMAHGNAVIGLLMNIMQAAVFVLAFYIMFAVLGLRGSALRGDFVVYLMSGIFLYLTHIKSVGAIVGAEGSTSAMMLHAPMNTMITITSAALGVLYMQTLSMVVILFVYHAAFGPITIHDPVGAYGMFLLAWLSGVAVGLVLLALKPWLPGFVDMAKMIYQRMNMIASGKMFVANTMPGYVLAFFDWNPLFHTIDQARGFAFINYNPHFSSISYPIYVSLALIMIGLMGEFYTRKYASKSWMAGR
ncbi:ABC transporter permease [Rhodovulum adriaticum]|uniref:ABC-type polysaccharide/polyol phosphate export permease n=1 Tax=Rhodovulum adriaticum TaxID=35804 RepID=A0A4R2NYP0_RHOAD|nr:ABC transporter permease [Rhodovulum adriaticum]MBK1636842.1 ABC transporter permease [Rhodovulum adriaticum]TCP27350.1 ABC-type polysaccharide/polyol phosphate export permease [Rhodovulum adriaticum]